MPLPGVWLVDRLRREEPISALVGDRIYPQLGLADGFPTQIVYHQTGLDPHDPQPNTDSGGDPDRTRYTIECYSERYHEAKLLAHRVREVLRRTREYIGAAGSNGNSWVATWIEDERDAGFLTFADTTRILHQVDLDFTLVYSPSAVESVVLMANGAMLTPSWAPIAPDVIPGLSEAIDDRVSSLLVAGDNVTLTYDDAANTLTIASSIGAAELLGYALLAGRAGGQTLIGGTASGDDLFLKSTAHATLGNVFFQATTYGATINSSAEFSNPGPSGYSGTENERFGHQAGRALTSGSANCFVGYQAGMAVTTGGNNVAIGGCHKTNQTGSDNLAIGVGAVNNGVNPSRCVGVGTTALQVTSGADNVGIGNAAGQNITSGTQNVCIGASTGASLTTGTSNVFLGYNTGASAAGTSYSVAIGLEARAGTNECVLGPNLYTLITSTNDGGTNSVSNIVKWRHNGGSIADGFGSSVLFQLESSTTENQDAYLESVSWLAATHGSRKARLVRSLYDTAARETAREWADGSAGRVALSAPASAPTDGHIANNQISFWLDETTNDLIIRSRKSDGTYLTHVLPGV